MKATDKFKTRLPLSVYGIIPKTLVVAAFAFAFTENWLITIAGGVPTGLLLHFLLNAYDSKVTFDKGILSFYYFRPMLRKQTVNLSKVDNAIVAPERKDYVMRDVWWKTDMLLPLGYSKLLLYRDSSLIYTLNFRTNTEDTRKLAELIKQSFPSELPTVHP